jgi:superfamily II DNA or RNA helicase
MSIKSYKPFQQLSIDSGLGMFRQTRLQLDAAADDLDSRAQAINHNGYLLLEAPTGAGKTLMAGGIVEGFSAEEDVVWFWFAPFKGVVGQTAGFLRGQFPGIRVRELQDDRAAEGSRAGDVFVTTWQTVATRVADKRNVRRDGEQNDSIDSMIIKLRQLGYRIGVVVDEAHHSFHGETQAAKFFREVLDPEYTILITATPDDADVADFQKRLGGPVMQRTSIARQDAVDAGLIKDGVRCAAYFVESDKAKMVDLEQVALRDAVTAHRRIKARLAADGVCLTPLLLVQVDSSPKSTDKALERLLKLGFKKEQVAVHTANEPDADILALADDEEREVLVFKMSVALGFDAPRAFVLCSMRAARDEDFGVQLVGRILRVHRTLQAKAAKGKLPDDLRYGYVFLADPTLQTGIDLAGQRINRIQTEYAKVSQRTTVVNVGGRSMVQAVEVGGQFSLFPQSTSGWSMNDAGQTQEEDGKPDQYDDSDFDLGGFFGNPTNDPGGSAAGGGKGSRPAATRRFTYPLRDDAPRFFQTQELSDNVTATEEDCAQRFLISTRALFEAIRSRVKVERKTLDVFTGQMQFDLMGAELEPGEIERRALRALQHSPVFDPRELRRALLGKVEAVLREEFLDEANDPHAVRRMLDNLLALHPEMLYEAQRSALAKHAMILPADPLPVIWESDEALPSSNRNLYGIMPADLNSWEQHFAQILDHDQSSTVTWWHRNQPHKPWAVNVLLPDGRGFFPDFLVGVKDRKTPDGVLLAEPKFHFERRDEIPKAGVAHSSYGKVLVLHREGGVEWRVVRLDEKKVRPSLGDKLRIADLAGWGL